MLPLTRCTWLLAWISFYLAWSFFKDLEDRNGSARTALGSWAWSSSLDKHLIENLSYWKTNKKTVLRRGEVLGEAGCSLWRMVWEGLRQGCVAGRARPGGCRTEGTMGQNHIGRRDGWNRRQREVITPRIVISLLPQVAKR